MKMYGFALGLWGWFMGAIFGFLPLFGVIGAVLVVMILDRNGLFQLKNLAVAYLGFVVGNVLSTELFWSGTINQPMILVSIILVTIVYVVTAFVRFALNAMPRNACR